MSDNKRKSSPPEIEQTSGQSCFLSKNNEKNFRRRATYHDMPSDQKKSLLKRHRADYSARKHHILENDPGNHSGLTNSSPEPPLLVPAQPTIFVTDKLLFTSPNEQLTQCKSVYDT
ncbi:hypothetical protein HAX54_015527, partial [Datura stramonium]|nr:hypothetical protein [Datura stramonium]